MKRLERDTNQLIIHTDGMVCSTARDLLQSEIFVQVVTDFMETLREDDPQFVDSIDPALKEDGGSLLMINLLRALAYDPIERAVEIVPGAEGLLDKRWKLHDFLERLYDFWRVFNRYMVLHSEAGPNSIDRRPYQAFSATIEVLTHLVRGVYRDINENIIGQRPRVYRQVSAGCSVGIIAVPSEGSLPPRYAGKLSGIPLIRQVLINPPLIIDPPMNKRTGLFRPVPDNLLGGLEFEDGKWLCYPAQVGPLVVFIYFHQYFIGLGSSLANLFEIADDEKVAKGPDAVFIYGADPEPMKKYGELPTVFHDDVENNLLVGAVPREDRFGYFGYLKKMALTLHNVVMMKRGRLPYHGAMSRIIMKNGTTADVLIIGDTATGKSESLEAFRVLGKEEIAELIIIADDMGSIEIQEDGRLKGYGTETGAFVRLDDLQAGYAFGKIDRSIIMSPQKTNARVVLPVTTLDEVLHGHNVDFILYANNFEETDADHPIIERFGSAQSALRVFREGAAVSKGTTTATGLTHHYFANPFGAPQYRELHDKIAEDVFDAAFRSGVFVGQVRTRLGIPGNETRGPHEAAEALLELILKKCKTEKCG
ncbi:MAG: phosphoenolpyruvate carboxykinase [Nitrospirota bacterium]